MRWLRPALILLAIAAWIWSVRLIFGLSWDWRSDYDLRWFAPDGQAGMDVFAFAFLVCLGYIVASAVALLIFDWWRRRRRDDKKR